MTIQGYSFPTFTNRKIAEAVHDRLVELGYTEHWNGKGSIIEGTLKYPGRLAVHVNSKDNKIYNTTGIYDSLPLQSLDDLFNTEKFKFQSPKVPMKVQLNKEYLAEVTDEIVKVGCQSFPVSKIEELQRAVADYKRQ